MPNFLEMLAKEVLDAHRDHLDQICVVFPSKRACVFFQDALLKVSGSPLWAPSILPLESFVSELTGLNVLDNVSLAFELYPLYKEKFPEETFDRFFPWANTLIRDYDEVDRYQVPAEQLFRNLHDLQEIDVTIANWLPKEGDPSEFEQRYLEFWLAMGSFYGQLHKGLEGRKMASPGSALKAAAENVVTAPDEIRWQKVIFAGFNALTTAEKQLMQALLSEGKAEVFWDMDRWYLEDKRQEAGMYFRELRKSLGLKKVSWIGDYFKEGERSLEVVGVPKRVGQAKAAGLLLEKLLAQGVAPDEIAVVLPDESLLFPLLHSLPENLREVNVTMGFPLRNTPLYSLVEALISLHENAERIRQDKNYGYVYYFRDLRVIARHPYVRGVAGKEGIRLLRTINAENRIYLRPAEFEKGTWGEFFKFLLQPWTDVPQIVQFFLELYRRLRKSIEVEEGPDLPSPTVELEYIFQFYVLTRKLKERLALYDLNFDIKTFRRLYKEVIHSASIPFAGEPLRGLQIMGMLETRCLDFPHLILLSVNEDILPAAQTSPSFIPFSLRKAFGLPTYEEKDAVYAYHFFRLLQRANKTWLLHNTEADTLGSAERSRFISQIKAELLPLNPKIAFKESTITFSAERETVQPIVVKKSEPVLETLRDYVEERGFSPSGLLTYLKCSLQFYFRYVLRLREREEAEEQIEAHTFGKVAHLALEKLYLPWKDKTVDETVIDDLLKRVEKEVISAFKEETHNQQVDSGKNFLIIKVIQDMVQKLLEIDRHSVPFTVLGLEEKVEWEVTSEKTGIKARLSGIIDRIDQRNGETFIIDYKTGRVDNLKLGTLSEFLDKPKQKEAFQLASYGWLFLQQNPETEAVRPGIYSLRKLSSGLMELQWGPQKVSTLNRPNLKEYTQTLSQLLDEIFDPEFDFLQTEDRDNCQYCAYQQICSRT